MGIQRQGGALQAASLFAFGHTRNAAVDVVAMVSNSGDHAGEQFALTWIEADVTGEWTLKAMDVWHDRAVFHVLTTPDDRGALQAALAAGAPAWRHGHHRHVRPGRPERCGGLPVERYSPEELASELGAAFELRESRLHTHTTPWGQHAGLPVLAPAAKAHAPRKRGTS